MNNNVKISLALGITCFALTLGIVAQLNTVNSTNLEVSQDYELNELRDNVLKYKERYENKYEELEKVEEELEEERQSSIENNGELEQIEVAIKEGNEILGLTEVKGTGVKITLADSEAEDLLVLDPNSLLIHAEDILNVINELKNAGAEAIAINGQRIVNTTGIVCSGNIVDINGQKIGTPFVIEAIGLPEQLATLDRPGGYLDALRAKKLEVDFEKSNNITIPKFTGVLSNEYITTIN